MVMRIVRILPFLLLVLDACVERLDVPVATPVPALVVDGLLTDEDGPHVISLYLSSKPNMDLPAVVRVKGATVKISDDLGNEESLVENADGNYQTSAGFKGVVGRSYRLSITTSDGKKYESDLQKMAPAGTIEDMYFEYEENAINKDDVTLPQDVVKIYIDGKGLAGAPNLYRWRWNGTYGVRTYPERKQRRIPDTGVWVPDPLPCSGYVLNPVTLGLNQVGPCVCCDCWVSEFSSTAFISKNSLNGLDFKGLFLAQIPVEAFRFHEKYYVEAEQLSLTDEVYDFWKLVEIQQKTSGDLFQPNVVQIRGNMHSMTNSDEPVFGIFSVSAVAKRTFFLDRVNDLPKPVANIDTLVVDCRLYFKNSSNERPPFW
jgi:hypothetical protein